MHNKILTKKSCMIIIHTIFVWLPLYSPIYYIRTLTSEWTNDCRRICNMWERVEGKRVEKVTHSSVHIQSDRQALSSHSSARKTLSSCERLRLVEPDTRFLLHCLLYSAWLCVRVAAPVKWKTYGDGGSWS